MAASSYTDDVSLLARNLADRVAALCPNVPAGELAELTSRLALAEHARATGVSFSDAEPQAAVAPLGNRVVWLPGPSATAIVLPAGEEPSRAVATAAKLLAWAQRRATPMHALAVRGSAALRQIGAALVSAYQARPRVQ